MNSTSYAKRTAYKPVDFFFRAVSDVKTKKVEFVDAFQILNDRYLGRMSSCNYFFIAENSVRINELNVIALDELKNYHLVMRENFMIPEKLVYSLPITTRFFDSDKEFAIFLSTVKDNAYKKTDIMFSFDCNTMQNLDDDGRKRYNQLRRLGFKTCLSGFGELFNSLDIFARYKFDYIRTEANYFDAADGKKKLLEMLVKFASANKIKLVMEGMDFPPQKKRLQKSGVKLMTGKAVSKLSRYVTNELLNLPPLTDTQKQAYAVKLEKELEFSAKKEQAELEEFRRIAAEKAEIKIKSGKVMPSAPRPELIKSPYQVRLEQQKQSAKKVIEPIKLEDIDLSGAKLVTQKAQSISKQEKKDMSSVFMFEGGVQSALSLSYQAQGRNADVFGQEIIIAKSKPQTEAATEDLNVKANGKGKNGRKKSEAEKQIKTAAAEADDTNIKTKSDINTENNLAVRSAAGSHTASTLENEADDTAELKIANGTEGVGVLLNESASNEISSEDYFGEGYENNYIQITAADGETYTGNYNGDGKWVDMDGVVYDGYFDGGGNWINYEAYEEEAEGHYNDDGQWVDAEGNVYDGYFDGDGRWIDYSYQTDDGETVSNGYFDDKLKKWIPYGYFNDAGEYTEF